MKNKPRDIILLDPNETANLINVNLIRHINSNVRIRAFEMEHLFRKYLSSYKGRLFHIYIHEQFSKDLQSLLFSICSLQDNVEMFIISENRCEVPNIPKIKLIHQDSFIQELTEKLSY